MFIYIGPEQVLPLSGVLGTVLGLVLMFWGKLQDFYHKLMSRYLSEGAEKPKSGGAPPAPRLDSRS